MAEKGRKRMKDAPSIPSTRSWRDIPQHVKPRAMSKEGRRRVRLRVLKAAGGAAALGLLGLGAWEVSMALHDDARSLPSPANAGAIRAISLATDGVLDRSWLVRTLALPKNANLMGIDLAGLRARVLAGGQARTAALVRDFPGTLTVRVSERSPVARVEAPADGGARTLLVARDGVTYEGYGYDPAMIESLPWLEGAKLTRQGGGFLPIREMPTVADLLGRAQLETAPVYRTWRKVSLARLQSDGEIDVLTRDGLKVTFSARDDYFRQLAKLDLLLDLAKGSPGKVPRAINLSLGGQVPVTVGAPPAAPASGPAPAPSSLTLFQIHQP